MTEIEDIDLSKYAYIEFYIYVENEYNYTMRIGSERYNKGGEVITLQPNEWNLVRLPVKADALLATDFLQLLGRDGNTGLDSPKYAFYISSIYGISASENLS